jgi:hypothetical protein
VFAATETFTDVPVVDVNCSEKVAADPASKRRFFKGSRSPSRAIRFFATDLIKTLPRSKGAPEGEISCEHA